MDIFSSESWLLSYPLQGTGTDGSRLESGSISDQIYSYRQVASALSEPQFLACKRRVVMSSVWDGQEYQKRKWCKGPALGMLSGY